MLLMRMFCRSVANFPAAADRDETTTTAFGKQRLQIAAGRSLFPRTNYAMAIFYMPYRL